VVQGKEQGQGLEVQRQGQRLVNWTLRILEDKDFPPGQQHHVTVNNGLLTDIYIYIYISVGNIRYQ